MKISKLHAWLRTCNLYTACYNLSSLSWIATTWSSTHKIVLKPMVSINFYPLWNFSYSWIGCPVLYLTIHLKYIYSIMWIHIRLLINLLECQIVTIFVVSTRLAMIFTRGLGYTLFSMFLKSLLLFTLSILSRNPWTKVNVSPNWMLSSVFLDHLL